MTTPIVQSITDEQLVEIEADGCMYVTQQEARGLITRLRAAEKDAQRYRYLRARAYEDDTEGDWIVGISEEFNFPRYASHEEAIDVAIDAAIKSEKPNEQV